MNQVQKKIREDLLQKANSKLEELP